MKNDRSFSGSQNSAVLRQSISSINVLGKDAKTAKAPTLRSFTGLPIHFDRLALINKERIVPLSSSSSFDYKVLAEAAGEVNKRAKRIKSNSPLPLKEKNNENTAYDADAAALSAMLPELSRMIDSFLGNQIFRVTSVNDGELRSAAGRDLGRIIRLSEAINKIAKRSTKTAAIR